MSRTRIFAFCNTPPNNDEWCVCLAIGEDGRCVGEHVCSHPCFGPHDLGATVGRHAEYGYTWHHDEYAKAYPDGFDVEWVDDPKNHAGLEAACAKNQARRVEAVTT